ncbi:conserved hypothetical protein [Beutenbergia cavernae DSM 12333]|uniref:Membrane protein YeiH n=1 Tax=Beutenbergia cavernae (strain ATCC BAA-8 / DSM 12333 / CCUG 43141 / JCM 11478 / NBRC 16432 / NCIMB 13614 / HKI 0122) TaxID=471853 RepID=C5BXB1_BEUC1|nr:putative sulfate exporter family transporter [Beutenbergia cavernae]ACQ78786.1 conserved hypothetical protein [Beutenbergia cavernae DSM 12333]
MPEPTIAATPAPAPGRGNAVVRDEAHEPSGARGRRLPWLAGLALAVAIAAPATLVGRAFPLLGAPVCAILLGAVVAAALRGRAAATLKPGLAVASRPVLQLGVILLGAQLSLAEVARVGADAVPVMLVTLAVCLLAAWALGRAMRVESDLRTLIGVGTAICGASAIAAVTGVLRPASEKVAYALSTVFVFNIAAALAFPPLGHALGLDAHTFGVLAGTAVNDMSSVVAAATAFGPDAAHDAVVVKLTRTLMIVPICAVLGVVVARRGRRGATAGGTDAGDGGTGRRALLRAVPWFLLGFLALAGANSAGLVPTSASAALTTAAGFLVTVALAAIGLSTDLAGLRRAGARPLLLGGALSLIVTGTSLAMLTWR